MHDFMKYDKEIAEAVIKSIERHLHYLTEQLVVLALFDRNLPSEERNLLGRKLYLTPRPCSFPPGKPLFPKLSHSLENIPRLHELVGSKSWLLFYLLKLDDKQEWLNIPCELWHNFAHYNIANDFVQSLICVNDCAERGIKLIQELKDVTTDPEEREYLAQTVEDHRQRFNDRNMSKTNIQSFL
jgi:hypothetical protein